MAQVKRRKPRRPPPPGQPPEGPRKRRRGSARPYDFGAGPAGPAGLSNWWVLPMLAAAVGVALFVTFIGSPAVLDVLGDVADPHLGLACVLGWLVVSVPLWVSVAFVAWRRLTGNTRRFSRWLFVPWGMTFVVSLTIVPPKRSSGNAHYEEVLAEHAGAMGHAIGVGAEAGSIVVFLLVPLGVLGSYGWSKLKPDVPLSDRRFVDVALASIVLLEVAFLLIALGNADLEASRVVSPSAGR